MQRHYDSGALAGRVGDATVGSARAKVLKACVVNYGALPTDPGDLQNIGLGGALGNFGALDKGITPDDVKAFRVVDD